MGSFLIDSNVLLDISTDDPDWSSWSSNALERAADAGRVLINPIIFAEVSIRFSTIEELDEALPVSILERETIPYEAAFLAGKCFVKYRQRGGTRSSPLPDFLIGAHAAVAGYTLLTRDVSRYRTYFPSLELITPEMEA